MSIIMLIMHLYTDDAAMEDDEDPMDDLESTAADRSSKSL